MPASLAKGAQSVACGQLVSLFSISSLIMAKYLLLRDVSTPAFLNCCFYVALSLIGLSYSFRQQGRLLNEQLSAAAQPATPLESPVVTSVSVGTFPAMDEDLETAAPAQQQKPQQPPYEPRWWSYPIVAFFDLQANCLAIRSLEFTDYASVGLILNLTIPFVLLLSCITFRHKYSWRHIAGCAIAAVGGLVLFLGSFWRDQTGENSQQLYGCFVALTAALMYGASNIANQLYLRVQGVDRAIESLGMIGAWGAGLAILQMIILERVEVIAIVWTAEVAICFTSYVLVMLSFYLLVSVLPRPTTASPVYNLSILVSNLYLAFASCYLFAESPHLFFFAALALILSGLTVHCIEHSRARKEREEQSKKVRVSFGSMRTPTDLKLVAIQIEQAAL
ncbi:hypothetical protein PybrP1_007143 [[Pythium] brassicae (nom. inval.)]|nr:hypothetical protein PybrP1_007143 [[Pythium] brassicae (nom. inval.)]